VIQALKKWSLFWRTISLVVVANEQEEYCLLQNALRDTSDENRPITQAINAETRIGQPYNDFGTECLTRRLHAMMSYRKTKAHVLEGENVGAVSVRAVENYTRIGKRWLYR
jgi:hypothetical protein